jgi:predicted transcriptional regulator
MKKKIMDLETRRNIYELIRENPGLHLREIERQLKMSSPLILYHLRFLEKYEIITKVEERGYKRYYLDPSSESELTGEKVITKFGSKRIPSHTEKKILGILREKIPLGIVLYILTVDGPVDNKSLSKYLGISKSNVTYHLKNLMSLGVLIKVTGDKSRCFDINDRKKISRLLITYKPTPDLIKEYGDMWVSIFED